MSSTRRYNLLKKYGLTEEAYRKMLEGQGGVCKICGRRETRRVKGKVQCLSVDHCHFSGKVRALLCHRCNHTLGTTRDNPKLLRQMADYLENKITYPSVFDNLMTQAHKFEQAVSTLPDVLREVATDRLLHGLAQKEIAVKFGTSQPWVSCMMGRALLTLSKILPDFGHSLKEDDQRHTAVRRIKSLEERQAAVKARISEEKKGLIK